MENLANDKSRYFFSCNFMWWVFHVTFPLNDEIESMLDDSMLNRVDNFDINAEELAEWYIEEALHAGKIFVVGESKSESLYTCSLIYEDRIVEIVNAFNPHVLEYFRDNYYKALFYFRLDWLHDLIHYHSKLVNEISLDRFNQTYAIGQDKKREFMPWIKQNLFELLTEIGEGKIADTGSLFNSLKNELTKKWESLVNEAVMKHTVID